MRPPSPLAHVATASTSEHHLFLRFSPVVVGGHRLAWLLLTHRCRLSAASACRRSPLYNGAAIADLLFLHSRRV
ncbi:hypothetical protein BHM03_00056638 [Ensete ventricosum]|nr:hypothetical protein BHM03_00056638 [Ensete ventricosum]